MASSTSSEDDSIAYINADWENYKTPQQRQLLKNIAVNSDTGWVNLTPVKEFCILNGASITNGDRDNHTDGEVDWVVTAQNGNRGRLSANGWSGITFIPLLVWVIENKRGH